MQYLKLIQVRDLKTQFHHYLTGTYEDTEVCITGVLWKLFFPTLPASLEDLSGQESDEPCLHVSQNDPKRFFKTQKGLNKQVR